MYEFSYSGHPVTKGSTIHKGTYNIYCSISFKGGPSCQLCFATIHNGHFKSTLQQVGGDEKLADTMERNTAEIWKGILNYLCPISDDYYKILVSRFEQIESDISAKGVDTEYTDIEILSTVLRLIAKTGRKLTTIVTKVLDYGRGLTVKKSHQGDNAPRFTWGDNWTVVVHPDTIILDHRLLTKTKDNKWTTVHTRRTYQIDEVKAETDIERVLHFLLM